MSAKWFSGVSGNCSDSGEELLDFLLDLLQMRMAFPNVGCAIPPPTPPENIRAMIETAHQYGV
jgi:uroporphyrinogen-III decarboxylase